MSVRDNVKRESQHAVNFYQHIILTVSTEGFKKGNNLKFFYNRDKFPGIFTLLTHASQHRLECGVKVRFQKTAGLATIANYRSELFLQHQNKNEQELSKKYGIFYY